MYPLLLCALPFTATGCRVNNLFGYLRVQRCLMWATAAKPLLLVLDSLDQIASAGTSLDWLPLPSTLPHVRLIVSAATGHTAK